MDIGTILLLLLGVGLIVAGGVIRRRSLAARHERHATRGPSPIQETQGVPPEARGSAPREGA